MDDQPDSVRWRKIQEFYDAALALPHDARESFLRHACRGDENLCRQVLRLISAYENNPDFLETPLDFDSAPLELGGQLFGDYRLARRLGGGGMGEVYLAERADGLFRMRVAVKILRSVGPRPRPTKRFDRERQILASFNHPHIARLLDGGTTDDGWPYLVMEFIEGVSITSYCAANGLEIADRLRLFLDLCAAVGYAHDRQVVHCDIKPDNILVTTEGSVKLLDFGIASIDDAESGAGSGSSAGTTLPLMTMLYASPEQVRWEAVGATTDIYSLGVVLYEMLAGELPYRLARKSPLAILRAINDDAVAPLPESAGGPLTVPLRRLLGRALAKHPADRHQSVREMADEVAAIITGRMVAAPPPVKRRRWSLFVPLGGMVALLIFVTTGLLHRWQTSPQRLVTRYAHQLERARDALRQGEHRQAAGILADLRADPRLAGEAGFEFGWLMEEAAAPRIFTHSSQVDQAMIVDAGRHLVTTSGNYATLSLWGIAEGTLRRSWSRPGEQIWIRTHTDQARALLIEAREGSLTVEDLVTGRSIAACTHPPGGLVGMFWLDGVHTFEADGTVRQWDLATCRSRVALRTAPFPGGELSAPYGLPAVIARRRGMIRVWSLTDGRLRLDAAPTVDSSGDIVHVTIDDQLRWLGLFRFPNQVEIFDLRQGTRLHRYDEPDSVRNLIFDAGNDQFITLHDNGRVKIRRLSDLRLIREFDLKENLTMGLLVAGLPAEDDRWLLCGTANGQLGQLDLTDLRRDHPPVIRQLHPPGQRVHLRLDRAGRRLVTSGSEGTARVWPLDRLPGGDLLPQPTGGWITSLAISPDGGRLVVGARDNLIHVWNLATRQRERVISSHTAWVLDVSYSPDGASFLSAGSDSDVKVWESATGRHLRTLRHEMQVHAASYSPDGRLIATASSDGLVRVWDAMAEGTPRILRILRAHVGEATSLAWSPDGKLLASGGYDGLIHLWDTSAGRRVGTPGGSFGKIWALAFAPDGRTLAAAGRDRLIRIYDVEAQKERLAIPGAAAGGLALVFSPDGRRLVFAGEDRTVRIFETGSGRELLRFDDEAENVAAVLFSRDGKTLYSGGWDRRVRIRAVP